MVPQVSLFNVGQCARLAMISGRHSAQKAQRAQNILRPANGSLCDRKKKVGASLNWSAQF
jgi:hypothetical protein